MSNIESQILENLKLYEPKNQKVKVGPNYDGGYIIIDTNKRCDLFISCGLADDVLFEIDFINRFNPEKSVSFDGTVERPTQLPLEVDFFKKNISHLTSEQFTTEGYYAAISGPSTNLSEYSKKYKDIFIKMDIEGFEWKWINEFDFSNVQQIVLECHGFFDTDYEFCWSKHRGIQFTQEEILSALEKLNKTHHLVHIRGTNGGLVKYDEGGFGWARGYSELFTVAELTFLRKDFPINGFNKTPLPMDIDHKQIESYPHVYMDKYPFVSRNSE